MGVRGKQTSHNRKGLLVKACALESLRDFGEGRCVCPDTSLEQPDAENPSVLLSVLVVDSICVWKKNSQASKVAPS